jgi:hypothetical protein
VTDTVDQDRIPSHSVAGWISRHSATGWISKSKKDTDPGRTPRGTTQKGRENGRN